MTEKKPQKKECLNCGHYKAYYTKAYIQYLKQDTGMCNTHNSSVDKNFTCDKWMRKLDVGERRKRIAVKALDNAVSNIEIIKQILCNEKDEL